MGNGPAVILVHGGLQASQNFMALGKALADDFTVYIPDRRGRGLSGPFGDDYSLTADAEDMQVLTQHTKAQNIFGLSSGAIITLQTAIIEPALKKVALYEPPILVDGVDHTNMEREYESALVKGNFGKAMISIIRGTGDSSMFAVLPAFITNPFMNFAIKQQQKQLKEDDVPLKALIPTFQYDSILVSNAKNIIDKSRNLKAEVLLLGGSKSQKFLTMALDQLDAALPNAKRVEFKGLGHIAASNGGKPGIIANELRSFFME
jgi:pimeloyl-ACP methyl ester carboxylesterase